MDSTPIGAGEMPGATPPGDHPHPVIGLRPHLSPAEAAGLRAGLPPPVRAKLERLELDAAEAHALVRLASDRAAEAQAALRDARDRLARLRSTPATLRSGRWVPAPHEGPTAKTWEPYPTGDENNLARAVADADAEHTRRVAQRTAAEGRWQTAARLAERAREFLGVPV
jgi:hypothetical protein